MGNKDKNEKRTGEITPIGQLLPPIVGGRISVDYSKFDHIELTDDEVKEALGYKRMLKHTAMSEQQKIEATKRMIEGYKRQWTFDELKNEIINERIPQLHFEFDIDAHNEKLIDILCLYFTGDQQLNSQFWTYPDGSKKQLSLKKGIGLSSSVKGTGKSILMSLFQQNRYRPYLLIETKVVSGMFSTKGEQAIDIHSSLLPVPPTPTFFYHREVGICFDDLGFEVNKNFFGTKSDVMGDVLFNIYSKCQKHGDFSWFHFTSNLSGTQFESRYDSRIRDRMREMFNFISVSGESRRK